MSLKIGHKAFGLSMEKVKKELNTQLHLVTLLGG